MRILSIIIVLFTMVVLQTACEPELVTSIELPTEDRKLVVSAFLEYEQDTHLVFVGSSIPNNTTVTGDAFVTNALVTVSDGQQKVTLHHLERGSYGFSDNDLPIIPGKTYYLEVQAPGFEGKVLSNCIIPGDFDPHFELISIDSMNSDQENIYEIEFRFKDVQGSADYYRITPMAILTSSFFPDTMQWEMSSSSSRPKLFTDEGKDGQWIHFKATISLYESEEYNQKAIGFEVGLFRTDAAYYKFHYPFVVGGYNGNNEGPFGEPSIIFSNITNGYGVFSGMVRKTLHIPMP